MTGFLKIIENDKYFIKHIPTKVWLKLEVSSFEINIQENYINRNNKEVSFELKKISKNGQITVSLSDKIYSKEFYVLLDLINNKDVVEGFVTGKNNHGLFMKIKESNLNCFLTLTKNLDVRLKEIFMNSRKGESKSVIVDYFDKSQIRLQLNYI